MAPKQAEETYNPPMVSSSEKEDEESGSFVQEFDSSGEEDDQEKPIQTHVAVPLATMPRPESSAYDEAKKKMKRTRTEATEEETSGDDDEAKTSMKKSRTEETKISEDETKKQQTPFQRLFSGEDELALLQGLLDFTSTKGDPFKDTDGFCDFVKELISFNASKSQLLNKVGKLKQKFGDTVKKSLEKGKGGEDKIVFSKGFEQKAFELSRKIWGKAGALASKSRKKHEPETSLATTPPCFGREVVSLFKDENLTSFGLDESTVLARWNMVPDGPKKRAMEDKLKRFKAMKVELCLKRIECVADTADMIFKEDIASSSDGK